MSDNQRRWMQEEAEKQSEKFKKQVEKMDEKEKHPNTNPWKSIFKKMNIR
ncbi:hypothetical protein [Paenibacillus sp. Soil724D2]|nr:hypothetical protein [Paenibacillus sp. Soil724D2]